MSIISPSGTVFVPSSDSRIHFESSSDLGAATPGGTFTTDEITPNAQGVWKLHFTFPAATENTVIFALWTVRSPYHIGLIVNQSQYVAGDTGSISVFGTEDTQSQAVLNSNPQVTIQLLPSGTSVTIPVTDDGTGADGVAGDGLFAGNYQFATAGTYLITASVTLPTAGGGSIVRTAERQVTVIDSPITLNSATIAPTGSGCANSMGIQLNVTAKAAGTYIFRAQLAGPDGTILTLGDSFDLSIGTQSVLLSFSMDTIKDKLGYVSPITVNSITGVYVDSGDPSPVVTKNNIGSYSNAACRDPITIESKLDVTETMQGSQISALNFSFPVYVTTAGSYDITFNIVDSNGMSIDQVHLSETLAAGENTISWSEPGEKFANTNGPYRVSGIIIVGMGNSATTFQLPATTAYSAAQFVGYQGTVATTATAVPTIRPSMLVLLAVLMAGLAGIGARRVYQQHPNCENRRVVDSDAA
jgi:hypothetical protein